MVGEEFQVRRIRRAFRERRDALRAVSIILNRPLGWAARAERGDQQQES